MGQILSKNVIGIASIVGKRCTQNHFLLDGMENSNRPDGGVVRKKNVTIPRDPFPKEAGPGWSQKLSPRHINIALAIKTVCRDIRNTFLDELFLPWVITSVVAV